MKKTFLFCLTVLVFTATLQAQSWSKLGSSNGSDMPLEGTSLCTDPSGNVYVASNNNSGAGPFVYKWDGTSWSILGGANAAFNNEIMTLCADASGNIYAGGEFTQDGHTYVAKWDGTSWSQLGNPLTDFISAFCFDKQGNMYAALGSSAVKLAGNTWVALGALNPNWNLNTICVDTNENVYVAGGFTDGSTVQEGKLYVAKWNGISWSELGNGVCPQWDGQDNQIFSILADKHGNIFAGGILYDSAAGQSIQVYKWDGNSWSAIGNGTPNTLPFGGVNQLCFDPMGNLYAAGYFSDAEGYFYVGKWNGTTWDEVGTGSDALKANNWILCIASDAEGNIYATGEFTDTTVSINGTHPTYVAKYSNPAAGIISLNNNVNISVYPNPATDQLNIDIQTGGNKYKLIDITGLVLQTDKLNKGNNKLRLNHLVPGIYVLEIVGQSGSERIIKVVKE